MNKVLYILALFRLTRLMTDPEETGPYNMFEEFRKFTGRHAGKSIHHEQIAEIVHCKYCFGIWGALLLFILGKYKWTRWIILILGIAGGQALIEEVLDRI